MIDNKVLKYLESKEVATPEDISQHLRLDIKQVEESLARLSNKNPSFIVTVSILKADRPNYRITTEGGEYLNRLENQTFQRNQQKINSKQIWLIGCQVVIAFLTIIATIYLGYTANTINQKSVAISELQANISKTQTEILAKSSQPFAPDLELITDPHSYVPAVAFLGDNKTLYNGFLVNNRIQNFGKADPVGIFCQILPENNSVFYAKFIYNYGFGLPEGDAIQLLNFTQKNPQSISYVIRVRGCGDGYPPCTSTSIIPHGWQSMTLSCQCFACTTSYFIREISFCVYDKDVSECFK